MWVAGCRHMYPFPACRGAPSSIFLSQCFHCGEWQDVIMLWLRCCLWARDGLGASLFEGSPVIIHRRFVPSLFLSTPLNFLINSCYETMLMRDIYKNPFGDKFVVTMFVVQLKCFPALWFRSVYNSRLGSRALCKWLAVEDCEGFTIKIMKPK